MRISLHIEVIEADDDDAAILVSGLQPMELWNRGKRVRLSPAPGRLNPLWSARLKFRAKDDLAPPRELCRKPCSSSLGRAAPQGPGMSLIGQP